VPQRKGRLGELRTRRAAIPNRTAAHRAANPNRAAYPSGAAAAGLLRRHPPHLRAVWRAGAFSHRSARLGLGVRGVGDGPQLRPYALRLLDTAHRAGGEHRAQLVRLKGDEA